jgi:hypothetical protein
MAYYDGELHAIADAEASSVRDMGMEIPIGVMDDLSMPDFSDWYFGVVDGDVLAKVGETADFVKCGATQIMGDLPYEHTPGHKRWGPGDYTFGAETYVYNGNVVRPGEDIIDALGINSTELNSVRWTVDTDNFQAVLTKIVK